MYPNLLGIEGFSMVVMILLGVIVASIFFFLYLHKIGLEKNSFFDLAIVVIITVLVGIIFAILFENIYEAIKASINGVYPQWTWGMTFYGGLFGGVLTFILMYRFYYLNSHAPIFRHILVITPGCIAVGHAFGRIGCFLSGCCYGIETGTPLDIDFPGIGNHLPTQLIEMAFLFILGALLLIFAFKNISNHTMPIYLISYGVFRFVIEFFRGDERGQLAGLSPSQYWCFILVLVGAVLIYFYKRKIFIKEAGQNEI